MRDTYLELKDNVAPKKSIFYTQSPLDPLGLEPYVADRTIGSAQATAFGGGFSTAPDIFKFLYAFRTSKLLGGEMTQKVAEGKFNLDDKGLRRWAYGMSESVVNGDTVRGHQAGSRADVQMLWQSGYTIIVLQNSIPPLVNAVSNDITAFITSQSVMRGKRAAR